MNTEPIYTGNPFIEPGEFQLTGQELLIYVSTRLASLDEEIGDLMGQARDAIARKKYVAEVKAWAEDVKLAKERKDTEKYQRLLHEFPEAPPGMQALKHELHSMFPSLGDASPESIEEFRVRLDGVTDEINGASEVTMLRINQLMGQRTICLQMATGMMKECNEANKAIAGNT